MRLLMTTTENAIIWQNEQTSFQAYIKNNPARKLLTGIASTLVATLAAPGAGRARRRLSHLSHYTAQTFISAESQPLEYVKRYLSGAQKGANSIRSVRCVTRFASAAADRRGRCTLPCHVYRANARQRSVLPLASSVS
ncbi:hypothetical protein EVAR_93210_1 [Eumeta japonica]|uniref:Uncharacterized protein n=1 Tax=Eumeta variegata TaxID=151549 RepID=A0A4C1TXL1_EUMVA|nr:hypothetical protein EVAR_93210_1 [Eumeta japonica]